TLIVRDEAGLPPVVTAVYLSVELQECIRGQDVEIGAAHRELGQSLDVFGQELVVGIERGDEITGRCPDGQVAGTCDAAVLLVQKRDLTGIRCQGTAQVV